ncbi:protein lin-54 homolog [Salmo trutta]|uniref:Lin-54 DREAM MuvB core complex component n=1 Tax=Salmo trutta TaxID=8032 RepID=A0A674AWP7_SALTR|nr:protein lin-54 homolog [Salmo trutta]XP_029547948.1 protein lin-54 homolog [Salmo trutta]XP_029547949.1 protein lin-54 homolog [Salmo trutta]XP_029547950.1 protein lin-54 homolog [Salmo trutta]
MDVVSPELNSLLPDEIMDTEAIIMDDDPPSESPAASGQSQPSDDSPVPMETDVPAVPEIVSLCSDAPPTQLTQAGTTSTPTGSTLCNTTSATQLLLTSSTVSSSSLTLRPATASTLTSTTPKTTSSLSRVSLTSGGLQKLSAPFTLSANHQIILNKVASSPGADTARSQGTTTTTTTPGGQQFMVTTIGKSGQPIVLQLPHTGSKSASVQGLGEAKANPQHFKVVTVSSASQVSTLQAQQLKTVQIAKKTQVSSAGPIKFVFTKAVNNKGLTAQTSVSNVITGRVLSTSSPVTPPRTITLSETLGSSSSSKIAISPLKSPSKLTVVSVASQVPNSPQKSVSLPLNMAHLGHQILLQQSTATSPAKTMKPVQTVTVGGVGAPQFKTIFPLSTPSNVQQIQVPGSRFHYVRLVTATTGSSTGHASSPITNSSMTAKPMVVNTTQVRMSVPIVPAQTMKQVVPKPLTSSGQVLTTQTQQRLIMPATSLPQIQPNLTNLPPGTMLAPGSGNMGYAVLPAQYITQLQQSAYVTLASSSGFSTPTGIQTQARLPLNGLSTSGAAFRPRKPCNCTKSQCLKLYCDCFANGEFCQNCNCTNCFNNLEHETDRAKAIKACLDRNPEAFKPKIGKGKEGESDRRHSKGCNCKRSGCLKNYCECYEAKIMCSSTCKCVGCKNFEESPERKTLMHLADAAEVRVQQQTAAKTKLSSQISDLLTRTTPAITSGGGRMPYTFVTKEVAEVTCECLLEQAEQAELNQQPQATAERMILEEFGRCLMRIISSAGKTDCPSINC